MYDLPTWALATGLLGLMFLANEVGFRYSRLGDDVPEQARNVSNGVKASILGLVAFLLGFSFSMTATRHDLRRRTVLDEANAIGTLYLRAGVIDEAPGRQIRDDLRKYVDARLSYFDHALDSGKRRSAEDKMDLLLQDVWAGSSVASEPPRRPGAVAPVAADARCPTSDPPGWYCQRFFPRTRCRARGFQHGPDPRPLVH